MRENGRGAATVRMLGTRAEVFNSVLRIIYSIRTAPQWGAADAEIKVPSGENTKLKRSPFKA